MKNKYLFLLILIFTFWLINNSFAGWERCLDKDDYFNDSKASTYNTNPWKSRDWTEWQNNNSNWYCYYECDSKLDINDTYYYVFDDWLDCNKKVSCTKWSDTFDIDNVNINNIVPSNLNTPWQDDDEWSPCYYECKSWWTWSDCKSEIKCSDNNINQSNTVAYNVWNPTVSNQSWQSNNPNWACYFKCSADWTWSECKTKVPWNCVSEPNINKNVTFNYWSAYYVDTQWQQTDKDAACFYKCTNWYSWVNCDELTEEEACFKILTQKAKSTEFPSSPTSSNGGWHFSDINWWTIDLENVLKSVSDQSYVNISTYEHFSWMHKVAWVNWLVKTSEWLTVRNPRMWWENPITANSPNWVNPDYENRSRSRDDYNFLFESYPWHDIFKAKRNITWVLEFSDDVIISEYATIWYPTNFSYPSPSENANYIDWDAYPNVSNALVFALHTIDWEFLSCWMYQLTPKKKNLDHKLDYDSIADANYKTDIFENSGFELDSTSITVDWSSLSTKNNQIPGTSYNYKSYFLDWHEFLVWKVSIWSSDYNDDAFFDARVLTIEYNNNSSYLNQFLTFPLQVKAMTNPDNIEDWVFWVVTQFRNYVANNTCLEAVTPKWWKLNRSCGGDYSSQYVYNFKVKTVNYLYELASNLFSISSANAAIWSFTEENKKKIEDRMENWRWLILFDWLPLETYNKIKQIKNVALRDSLISSVALWVDKIIDYKIKENIWLTHYEEVFKWCNIPYTERIKILTSFVDSIEDVNNINTLDLSFDNPKFWDCIIPFPDKTHLWQVIEWSFMSNQYIARSSENEELQTGVISSETEINELIKEKIELEKKYAELSAWITNKLSDWNYVEWISEEIKQIQDSYIEESKIIDNKIEESRTKMREMEEKLLDNTKENKKYTDSFYSNNLSLILIALFVIIWLSFVFLWLNKWKK